MSLKMIPGAGKSGTSRRVADRRSIRGAVIRANLSPSFRYRSMRKSDGKPAASKLVYSRRTTAVTVEWRHYRRTPSSAASAAASAAASPRRGS